MAEIRGIDPQATFRGSSRFRGGGKTLFALIS